MIKYRTLKLNQKTIILLDFIIMILLDNMLVNILSNDYIIGIYLLNIILFSINYIILNNITILDIKKERASACKQKSTFQK